jgi:putative PIN family toxin of toxin-antitoxin system
MGAPCERIRVVFDCMIFLQGAARRESPSGLCLLLAEKGLIELCVSRPVLDEIADVLSRPRVRSKFPLLTDTLIERFIGTLEGFSTFLADVPRKLVFARDPKDEPYINLARTAKARYLVSRDTDLLEITTGNDTDARRIREECPDLEFVHPVAFLVLIRTRPVC